MNTINLIDKIDLLAEAIADSIVFGKVEKNHATLIEYKKVDRKFKPRRVAKKKVYC